MLVLYPVYFNGDSKLCLCISIHDMQMVFSYPLTKLSKLNCKRSNILISTKKMYIYEWNVASENNYESNTAYVPHSCVLNLTSRVTIS